MACLSLLYCIYEKNKLPSSKVVFIISLVLYTVFAHVLIIRRETLNEKPKDNNSCINTFSLIRVSNGFVEEESG